MSNKIKFELEGMKFELPLTSLHKSGWNGDTVRPYIYLRAKHVASIVKQYVKNTHPQVVCSATSDVYSGGDSVDIYLSTLTGDEVSEHIRKDVNRFAKFFQEGHFDGMHDIYEYSDVKIYTDNGTLIKGGAKYVFVNNRPKFGTVPDVVRMLKDYQSGRYSGGARNLEESIKAVMGYGISNAYIEKALKLI